MKIKICENPKEAEAAVIYQGYDMALIDGRTDKQRTLAYLPGWNAVPPVSLSTLPGFTFFMSCGSPRNGCKAFFVEGGPAEVLNRLTEVDPRDSALHDRGALQRLVDDGESSG